MAKGKTFLASGILSALILVIAGVVCLLIWHVRSEGTTQSFSPGQVPRPASSIVEQVKNDQPTQIDAVIDGIWRLAALRPGEMGDRLPAWLGPLLRNKRYADVEGLSLMAMLQKAWNPASVAIFQEARVRALLADGQYAQALAEAKMYYNVAPFSQTPTAVDLLTQAWARTHGSQKIGESDIPRILQSIKVDSSRLDHRIDMTMHGSPYKFANQIAQGNLLLLAGRPAEAERSFLKSCEYAMEDWDLPQSLEGMAQAVRDQDGSINRARTLVNAWRAGHSVAIGIALPPNVRTGELEDAARQVVAEAGPVRTELPRASGDSLDPVNLPPADSSEPPFYLPVNDAILLGRLAPQSDPQLRAWLDSWQHGFLRNIPLQENQIEQLRQILGRSKLSELTLLKIFEAFSDISNDQDTTAIWLECTALKTSPRMADWLENWRVGLRGGNTTTGDSRRKLSAILGEGEISCELLFETGRLIYQYGGDSPTAAVLCAAAAHRAHEDLNAVTEPTETAMAKLQVMANCEAFIWKRIDAGDLQYERNIYEVSDDIVRLVNPKDPAMGWRVPWAMISKGQCLESWRETNQAIAVFQSIDSTRLEEDARLWLAWEYGIALEDAQRFTQAASEFRICAKDLRYDRARLASAHEFRDLLASNNDRAAALVLNDYRRDFGSDRDSRLMGNLLEEWEGAQGDVETSSQ